MSYSRPLPTTLPPDIRPISLIPPSFIGNCVSGSSPEISIREIVQTVETVVCKYCLIRTPVTEYFCSHCGAPLGINE